MDFVAAILAGGGAAIACGLSPFLPLLVLAVGGIGQRITLTPGFEWLGTWTTIIVLAGLVGLHLVGDKLPQIQQFYRTVLLVVSPIAGGIACAALVSPDKIPAIASFVIGAVLAEAMVLVRNGLRPALFRKGTTAALFEPFASIGLDGLAVILAILAVGVPVIGGPLAIIVLAGAFFLTGSLKRQQQQKRLRAE